MINDYIEEKKVKKAYQVLITWKKFYVECLNEWETIKIDRLIQRFELKHFG